MRASRWVAASAAAVFVAGLVLAQFGPRFNMRGNAGFLLNNKGVQKELKLSDGQIAKVDEQSKKNREKMQEAFGDQDKMQEVFKEISAETAKFIKDELNADQQKRLKQIQRQQAGPAAFAEEDTAKELKLTDEQKSDIKKINEELGEATREAFQGAFGDQEKAREARKKVQTLEKHSMEKITKMLTPEQEKTWKELTGEPFEVRFEGGPGGFGKKGFGKKGGKKDAADKKD